MFLAAPNRNAPSFGQRTAISKPPLAHANRRPPVRAPFPAGSPSPPRRRSAASNDPASAFSNRGDAPRAGWLPFPKTPVPPQAPPRRTPFPQAVRAKYPPATDAPDAGPQAVDPSTNQTPVLPSGGCSLPPRRARTGNKKAAPANAWLCPIDTPASFVRPASGPAQRECLLPVAAAIVAPPICHRLPPDYPSTDRAADDSRPHPPLIQKFPALLAILINQCLRKTVG